MLDFAQQEVDLGSQPPTTASLLSERSSPPPSPARIETTRPSQIN
jgi:hypothetical protein